MPKLPGSTTAAANGMKTPNHVQVGKRPKCFFCGQQLKPSFAYAEDPRDAHKAWPHRRKIRIKVLGFGYRNQGLFCSLYHGYQFAVNQIKSSKAMKPSPTTESSIEPAQAAPGEQRSSGEPSAKETRLRVD
jgi:hypothetical protein